MKKTCNRCGHQLDIDKRCCSSCGAFNPFFIAGFNTTTVQSEILEKQQLEEERLRIELAEKEKREQKIQRELEEAERRHQERLKEIIPEPPNIPTISEAKIDETITELQTGAQSEGPVVPLDKKPGHANNETPPNAQINKHNRPKRWLLITGVLVIILSMGSSLTYFYILLKPSEPNSSALHAETTTPIHAANSPVPVTEVNSNSNTVQAPPADDTKTGQKTTATTANVPDKKDLASSTEPVKPGHTNDFVLTVAKVKTDLVGRRLSGCGITIRKLSDIVSIGKPVYIERLPSGYMKYKVAAKVAQGNDVYSSTPYLYYSADGSFIKVDGTNCE